MSNLIQSEKQTYEEMWQLDGYHANSPGAQVLPFFLDMAGIPKSRLMPGRILDAGCGPGYASVALANRGFAVTMCDITDARTKEVKDSITLNFHEKCLWHDLRDLGWHDYVYCTDVLEHLPPQFTMLAIDQMLRVAKKGLFISVSLVPDIFGVWAGKSLHQTVRPYTWWRDSLNALGTLIESRDLLDNAVYLVKR